MFECERFLICVYIRGLSVHVLLICAYMQCLNVCVFLICVHAIFEFARVSNMCVHSTRVYIYRYVYVRVHAHVICMDVSWIHSTALTAFVTDTSVINRPRTLLEINARSLFSLSSLKNVRFCSA